MDEHSLRPGLIFDFLYELDDLLARAILNNGGQHLTPRERGLLLKYVWDVLGAA